MKNFVEDSPDLKARAENERAGGCEFHETPTAYLAPSANFFASLRLLVTWGFFVSPRSAEAANGNYDRRLLTDSHRLRRLIEMTEKPRALARALTISRLHGRF